MKNVSTQNDIARLLQDHDDKLNQLFTKIFDMHGRQIKNLGASNDPSDAINRRELSVSEKKLWEAIELLQKEVKDIKRRLDAGGL